MPPRSPASFGTPAHPLWRPSLALGGTLCLREAAHVGLYARRDRAKGHRELGTVRISVTPGLADAATRVEAGAAAASGIQGPCTGTLASFATGLLGQAFFTENYQTGLRPHRMNTEC